MQIESRMTWEKLVIELELLGSEDTSAILQLLVGLNSWLCPEDSMEWASRNLNFMTYELMAQSEGLTEAERFELLNQYYFKTKGFQVLQLKTHETQERHLLLKPVLENRAGAPLAITMLYLHFAAHLDLPAYLIQLRNHYLLKWVRGGRSSYIDLCNEGRLLSEEELIQIMARVNEPNAATEPLSILPNRKIFLRYSDDLVRIYDRTDSHERLYAIYNVILKVEPQNSRIIGRRALLCRKMGLDKEALADLKRYFSFVDRGQAPTEMVVAFQELTGRTDVFRSNSGELLH
ncbi:MAG: transglutaminase family protein [Bdellovibrionales bacterium]